MGLRKEAEQPSDREGPADACRVVRSRLPLLPGDELDPADAAHVREHLTRCFACARELRAWDRAAAVLRGLAPGPGASRDGDDAGEERFFAALKGQVLARTAHETIPVERARNGRRSRLIAAGAAAALFLLGLGIVHLAPGASPRLLGNSPLPVPSRPEPTKESRFSDLGRFSMPDPAGGAGASARARAAGALNSLGGNIGLAGRITAARRLELLEPELASPTRWVAKRSPPAAPGRSPSSR